MISKLLTTKWPLGAVLMQLSSLLSAQEAWLSLTWVPREANGEAEALATLQALARTEEPPPVGRRCWLIFCAGGESCGRTGSLQQGVSSEARASRWAGWLNDTQESNDKGE